MNNQITATIQSDPSFDLQAKSDSELRKRSGEDKKKGQHLAGAVHTSIIARKGVSKRIPRTTTTTATAAIIERPMRFNEDLFRKETYCQGHWWAGDTCLYGAHSLIEEELLRPDPQVEEGSEQLSRLSRS